jgi:hypothetical protein
MGQFVQTNGDYTIKTGEGATIKLDTGDGVGQVYVTGNLVVVGEQLTVQATDLNVEDNIIILNYGETGSGVTLRYSGIQVDRGSAAAASIVYDEVTDTWLIGQGVATTGALNFSSSKIKLKEILTDSSADAGDLTLIGTGSGVIKVREEGEDGVEYKDNITDPNHIPNKKYVDEAIRNNPTFQIIDDNTRVIVTDKDVSGSLAYLNSQTGYSTFGESGISVIVDGRLTSQFYSNRALIQNLEFNNNEVTNNDTNGNIILRTQGTGKLQTNYALQLDNIGTTPAYVSNSTLIYGAQPDIGSTGVYFANSTRNGELINKNRALLFSMIF